MPEERYRFTVRLSSEADHMMKKAMTIDNCQSQNEFTENAIRFYDPDHSEEEDRFLMLGISFTLRVLVVCHCYRASDTVIRIISARKADKQEKQEYQR